jgi:glycosyltransferase involved in cell wall biosynthesis
MTPRGDNEALFIIVSFEGPDRYSLSGGLGVRVIGLSNSLAAMGFPVHHFFIGDPRKPGEERVPHGDLVLHRWCQWISEYYPRGVYEGEYEKLNDLNDSLPPRIVDLIIREALARDRMPIVLGEEWHTAEAMCRIHDLLKARSLRDRTVMLWNANNTFGFDRIDWRRLEGSVTITTVSRYMKHLMWDLGVNPLVIPNGIDRSLLREVDADMVRTLKTSIGNGLLLSKIARWDPDKRWKSAIEAVADLKKEGEKVTLLARGGIEPHGEEVKAYARSLGLQVKSATTSGDTAADYIRAIADALPCDIVDIGFHLPQSFLRVVYRASDAVLANSGHEPFGLVGLETMAAGGVAYTGGTGEDYALPYVNSIVLESGDPDEIEANVTYMEDHPRQSRGIREAGRRTAAWFVWEMAIEKLMRKVECQARSQGIRTARPEREAGTAPVQPSAPPPLSARGKGALAPALAR